MAGDGSASTFLVCQQEHSQQKDHEMSLQEAAAAAAAAAAGSKTPKDKDKAIKELIKGIPREQKAVFAYSLKWDAFDDNADALLPKLSKWVRLWSSASCCFPLCHLSAILVTCKWAAKDLQTSASTLFLLCAH